MAVGANLNYDLQRQMKSMFWELMNSKRNGPEKISRRKISWKAGVPANNTAADNPNALGDICIDTSNLDIYVCTVFSEDASATTWTKITA